MLKGSGGRGGCCSCRHGGCWYLHQRPGGQSLATQNNQGALGGGQKRLGCNKLLLPKRGPRVPYRLSKCDGRHFRVYAPV